MKPYYPVRNQMNMNGNMPYQINPRQNMPYYPMPNHMYMNGNMPYQGIPYQMMYSGYTMICYCVPNQMYMAQQMINENGQMNVAPQMMPHPILVLARQIKPNQIEITYDKDADLNSATNVRNYWIRNNLDMPSDIATLARDDMMLLPTNSLTPEMATIKPVENSKTRYVITFNMNATSGVEYTVLPCFVNLEGREGFTGANFGPESMNTFTGQ